MLRGRRWLILPFVLCTILATSTAQADEGDEPQAAGLRGRFGGALGGSWLPLQGDTSTLVARVSAGFDLGRFSLRALPTFQYVSVARYPSPKMTAGYLALEAAFRVAPPYVLSIAPLVGYAHSPDPNPGCYDVCYEPLGNGLMVGADASPATFVLGPDDSIEVGLHGTLFEFPQNGQLMLGAHLEARWSFGLPAARATSVSSAR
jgi:hypothetical protein